MTSARRDFLKMLAAAGAVGAIPAPIERALALPAHRRTGTIADVEHVVILMQENRSFDHYFGALRGVRGFGDPRPIRLPGGRSVWRQPLTRGADDHVLPFRLNADGHNQNAMTSLDHSWKGHHEIWKHHDAWIERKSALTMGYHSRADLPFYYALADAFTICDGYHASIHGPTNPNRMYLFSGTSGLTVGNAGKQVVTNADDGNWTADATLDARDYAGLEWTTYAERLEKAGVSWRVYQEYDNFGDNSLAYFKAFRGLAPTHPLYAKGRAIVPGSTRDNALASDGEHLVGALRRDVMAGTLPQVSWIVASSKLSEHPELAGLEYGQMLAARILDALTANPDVWARTVFLINYDENDGFFDHMPAPLPAITPAMGASTVDVRGEAYGAEPVGLGIRVPMLVISPWSRGGWVNSEVFDHSSVLRFLERRFGVEEPNISPWRRAVTGDLTSAFDFAAPDAAPPPPLPGTADSPALVARGRKMARPVPPHAQAMPQQEPGQRPARALPYRLAVEGRREAAAYRLRFQNSGTAGAHFHVIAADGAGPWFYTVGSGQAIEGAFPANAAGDYNLDVHGPNGFLRSYRGALTPDAPDVQVQERYDGRGNLRLTLRNMGAACTLSLKANHYQSDHVQQLALGPQESKTLLHPIAESDHWYDLSLHVDGDDRFERRLAGHVETGRHSRSDPGFG